jgi:hypothetical protein
MKTSARLFFCAFLALCMINLASLSTHPARAEGLTKEEAVKKLEAKGAKFLSKAEFEKSPLFLKAKGGRVVPSFSCSTGFCTCTGVIDCIDLGLDTALCNKESFTCQETAAGPSCVCAREQP